MIDETNGPQPQTRHLAGMAVAIAAALIPLALAVAILWLASTAIITIAASVLIAVLLDAGARGLGHVAGWHRHARLMIVFVVAAGFVGAAGWFGGTIVADQAQNFVSAMRQLLKQANEFVQNGGLGFFPKGTDLSHFLPDGSVVFGGATTALSMGFQVVVLIIAIVFLGAFLAWEPEVYKAVLLNLLPRRHRERVSEVLDHAADGMRDWLVGQSVSMIVVFLFSLMALTLVGMPYPALLAVQAGLLTFIPTVGPFVAGVIIVLAGLSQNGAMALYGIGTYVLIQFLETHLVTPIVQERTIRLPPAVTLALQVVAGTLFGLLGIVFVVPIAAAGKVIIEELYVEDWLGGAWQVPGHRRRSAIQSWVDRLLGRQDVA